MNGVEYTETFYNFFSDQTNVSEPVTDYVVVLFGEAVTVIP